MPTYRISPRLFVTYCCSTDVLPSLSKGNLFPLADPFIREYHLSTSLHPLTWSPKEFISCILLFLFFYGFPPHLDFSRSWPFPSPYTFFVSLSSFSLVQDGPPPLFHHFFSCIILFFLKLRLFTPASILTLKGPPRVSPRPSSSLLKCPDSQDFFPSRSFPL